MMNTISLCCTTNNPNPVLLQKMLDSAIGFDQIIVHVNGNQDIAELPIKLPNRGFQLKVDGRTTAGQGFNKCIERATSEWICCFCDDDFFHHDNLSELMSWFHSQPLEADIIHFPCFVGNDNIDWKMWGYRQVTYDEIRRQNMLPFSCFYRKSLWEKVGGYDDSIFNDWTFWLKCFSVGSLYHPWNKPIYYFLQAMEERLSDKERKLQPFELTREQILKRLKKYENMRIF